MIGYIFEIDHWNLKSLAVINSAYKKFSSKTVHRECLEIYEKNIQIVSRELQKTIAEVHRSKSIDVKKLSFLIDDFYSKNIILNLFSSDPSHDKGEFVRRLRNLMRETESRCHENFEHLVKLVTFCNRDQPYNEIYQIFKADGLSEIDPFDVEIILDAHHVGLQVKDLFLITGDYKHIVSRKDIIKSNLKINMNER